MKIPDHIRQAFKVKVRVKNTPYRQISDGYWHVRRPSWYTSSTQENYVSEHVVVYCEVHNLTEIPKGFVVHHVDYDKLNNEPNNLQMMTNLEHSILHNPSKVKSS